MTLTTLKAALQTITGTDISEVIFDSELYFNTTREKSYPFVLWSLDGAKFEEDLRTTTIQKTSLITIPAVFIVINYDSRIDDKIATWDIIKGYFDTYINKLDALSSIKIVDIDKLKGVYLQEGANSADKELGIMFPNLVIKTFC